MASVYNVKQGIGTTSTSAVDQEGLITRTHVVPYTIALDDGTTDTTETVERQAQLQGDLPKESDAHPLNRSLKVTNINTVQKSVIYYESTVTYSTIPFREGNEGDSPLELPAEIEFFTATEPRVVDYDFDGNPLANIGTNESYQLEFEQTDLGVTIKKNMLFFNPVSIYVYNNKVNADVFLGFPPGTAKIHNIRANNAVEEDQIYWEVTVEILFRQARPGESPLYAWYERVLHQGFYAMFDGVKKEIRIDDNGILTGNQNGTLAISQREWLNDQGELLGESEQPYFQLVKKYGTTTFANLGLF